MSTHSPSVFISLTPSSSPHQFISCTLLQKQYIIIITSAVSSRFHHELSLSLFLLFFFSLVSHCTSACLSLLDRVNNKSTLTQAPQCHLPIEFPLSRLFTQLPTKKSVTHLSISVQRTLRHLASLPFLPVHRRLSPELKHVAQVSFLGASRRPFQCLPADGARSEDQEH